MKTGNMTYVYGSVAVLSLLLLITYFLWDKNKKKHFVLLFSAVSIANCGYFLQSAASTLTGVMWANRISYFGSAYLMLLMLYIVIDTCQINLKNWVRKGLYLISTMAFLLAASGDWLGLYYRSVEIVEINGMTRLIKDYGPLHILYTVYLLLYVVLMVVSILYARKKQLLTSPKYTMLLFSAVLLNVGVWAVEQAIDIDFEFLSVSYIVTEVILLLIYEMLQDYGIVQPSGTVVSVQMLTQLNSRQINPGSLPPGMEDMFHSFAEKVKTLSTAERRILGYYIDGHEAADIPELAFISIHTVKKHNRSIYQKLEVASRDELMLYIELFRCCDRLHELTGQEAVTE